MSTSSNSQSFSCLINLGFQLPPSQASSTRASLEEAIEKRFEKASLNGISPHHLSFQNFTLFLEPTLKRILTLRSSQPFLIAFQTPTPYLSLTPFVHQPSSSCPYFPTITCFQRGFLSVANLEDHFPVLIKVSQSKHYRKVKSVTYESGCNIH